MGPTEYYIVAIIVSLVAGVIFGFITKSISEGKGYSGGFGWGFFLGVIGIIVVACKPSLTSSSGSSYSTSAIHRMIQEEVKKEVQRVLTEERLRMIAEAEKAAAQSEESAQPSALNDRLNAFWERAAACSRITELQKLWESDPPCDNEAVLKVLRQAVQIEKMYGVGNIPKTIQKIKNILSPDPFDLDSPTH